ncbi:MAG TPA: beta-ketoacyl synthase N-terminal-like domain-containing protein [Acidimicrobiales bacterium]|nr:beta-ketoacyl synthase N-terminal-like domain-containing protein [Acidimicrobiales bacterium]
MSRVTRVVEPVAVVGMAGIFPGAADLGEFWDNLVAGRDAISDVPADRVDPVFFAPGRAGPDRFYCSRGGFIDPTVPFDPSDFGIMPVAAAGTEPDQLLALATAARALADAGYVEGVPDPRRVGVVVGRGGYLTPATARLEQRVRTAHQLVACVRELVPDLPADRLDAIREQFQAALGPSHPEASIGLVPNLVASLVANRLDLQGPAYTLDAACASSLLAVAQAATELDAGRADLMLAGGVHHCHDVTLWSVFSQLKALSPTGVIRPFDRRADGILIGEGTGIVVLKRLADARAAGDRVYAVIRGTGVSSDGRAATLMSPASKGQALAIERAWQAAGLDPTTVGLIEAHGSATRAGDSVEIATLRRVFEAEGEAPAPPVGLGSVKSNIGHAMPASGIAGLIKSALALHRGVIPPTLGCDDPHPDLEPSRFRVVTEARPWPAGGGEGPRRVGINAFGFGGINAHVILEEVEAGARVAPALVAAGPAEVPALRWGRPRRRRSAGADAAAAGEAPPRLFVAAARDPAALAERLADGDAVLAGSDLAADPGDGPARLAIADPTPKRLDLARRVVARGSAWRGRNDVWFSPAGLLAGGGRVAFAFPGVEPSFDAPVGDVVRHFGLAIDAPVPGDGLENQAAGIIHVGRVLSEGLARLGVAPDVVVGHSLGEWTALLVARAVSLEAIDRYVSGVAGGDLTLPDLVFLALGCGVETAEEAIADLDEIVVSHDNCPHQVIVCGREDSVAETQRRLAARRVLGQVLPFRTGFHTPMFRPHVGPFMRALRGLDMHPATIPLWSSVSAGPFPDDGEAMMALAVRLYTERVRFRELVDRLHGEGVRAFVQMGVGSVAGFVADTLHDRPHLAVAAAQGGRPGLAQLARAAAALYVEGADVRLDRLAATTAGVAPERGAGALPARPAVLRFDSSLVRAGLAPLDPPAPAAPAVPTGLPDGAGGPVADEFVATMRAVHDAGREVLAALVAGPPGAPAAVPTPRRPPARPAVAAPAAARPAPASGPAAALPGRTRERRRLSLAEVPELIDHSFYKQPEGVGTVRDRFPVVPMTMMIALFVEKAAALSGRAVVGLQGVRALRWLAVEPPVDVDITTSAEGPDRIRVAIEGYARATVLLGDRYADPPPPDAAPLTGERPPPHSARELYEQRWMFHGPAYQGVTAMHAMGTDGLRATVTALPAPGALLDAAGQLLGYWIEANSTQDRIALPMRIDRIDFHGPHPEPGAELSCVVRFTEVNETDARGNVDLVRDGVLWARLTQFIDRRFESTGAVYDALTFPESTLLAERRDGYWFLAEPWRSSASRDLIARRYLAEEEREEFFALRPNAQSEWLLGRIVVKDAVRDRLWQRGAGPLFPIEVRVANDADGRPVVTGPEGPVTTSLAHRAGVAVAALAEPGGAAGIDVETVEARPDGFARLALRDGERALGAGLPPERWLARAWTVKEAAAKADGTGLRGRPRDFEIRRLDGDWALVGDHWVRTTQEGEFVVSTVGQRDDIGG